MNRQTLALALPTLVVAIAVPLAASCNKKRDAFAEQGVALEVYKREAAPKRTAMLQKPLVWLETAEGCPSTVMPQAFTESDYDLDGCSGPGLDACLEQCKNSVATACYASALILQSDEPNIEKSDNALSTGLFARACTLGNASACTNWAASLEAPKTTNRACLRATFEATCERGRDAWGCTMFGYIVAEENLDAALLTKLHGWLPTSCRYGAEDPACQSMKALIADASAALNGASDAGAR